MARFSAVLNACMLVMAWSTCSTESFRVSNQDQQIYESRLSALESEIKALRSQRSLQVSHISQDDGLDRDCCTINAIPTSCQDLQKIGYYLSGIYSVKAGNYVQSVYCDFTKAETSPSYQVTIGTVDIKTPVYFYFQKDSSFSTAGVPVPFEIERINVGGAFTKAGVFTAPKTGNYGFSLHGVASYKIQTTKKRTRFYIYFTLNSVKQQAGSYADVMTETNEVQYEQFSLQSTFPLKKGDKISLQIDLRDPDAAGLNDDFDFTTHFNGWLVEEDLSTVLKLA